MYVQTIRRLLELAPAGLSNEQLIWQLQRFGTRISAEELLDSLVALAESGEALRTSSGRWMLPPRPRRHATCESAEAGRPAPASDRTVLKGVLATLGQTVAMDDLGEGGGGGQAADADWRRLLAYYAATQRADPRGRVAEFVDRHAVSWQVVWALGNWWSTGRLTIGLDGCPATFREALSKRRDDVACIGYPLTLFDDPSGVLVEPALLLPATITIRGQDLLLDIAAKDPTINPEWLATVCRRTSWKRQQLVETLVPEGASGEFSEVTARLQRALATFGASALRPADLASELVLGVQGMRNAAALFLPTDTRFTAGAERDLTAMTGWSAETLSTTAVWPLIGAPKQTEIAGATAAPFDPIAARPLTDRQFAAAQDALTGPVTLIQGPPGTGKSEVILALMTSAVLNDGNVLFASRNHQALDEVDRRLKQLVPGRALLVRARDADGEQDTNFFEALAEIAAGSTASSPRPPEPGLAAVRTEAAALRRQQAVARRATSLRLRLAEEVDRPVVVGTSDAVRQRGFLARIVAWLTRWRGKRTINEGAVQRAGLAKVRSELAALAEPRAEDIEDAWTKVNQSCIEALAEIANRVGLPDEATRARAADRVRELKFAGKARAAALDAEDARLVLRHRPIWAVSTLSAAARIPLQPGLFDLVVFDEASQCDIASALPLLARARRAVVVGDPQQLGFIPPLSQGQEHALMDAAGLGPKGRHKIAQSLNALFDFARGREGVRWHFLADQFRSSSDIVDYLNDDFYEGRLFACADARKFRYPNGYKPGLAWHQVEGRTAREDGGNVNHAEAEAVVRLVTEMIRDRRFQGSIGVLSPFNTQIALINRKFGTALRDLERQGAEIRIATIDKFQGGEADVVLFSIVVGEGSAASARMFYERERKRLNVAISRARAVCVVVGDRHFALQSRIRSLAHLAERTDRAPKPRAPFESLWERRLYEAMEQRGIGPIHAQYPVGSRYLDFAIDPDGVKLDVEVDGRRWHTDLDGNRKVADRLRDRELLARGWKVRRFWVHELAEDLEKCLDGIESELGRR